MAGLADAPLDTGSIFATQAELREEAEERADEEWQRSAQCMDCEWCNVDYWDNRAAGWCEYLEVPLSKADMEDTVWEAGCFR